MNKESIIGIVMLCVIGAGVFYLNQNFVQKNKPVIKVETDKIKEEPARTLTEQETISGKEVAKHNSADNCWIIVDNMVYDLTNFAEKHPGGITAITSNCGADGTNVFNTRGDRGPHPETAKETLKEFQLGILE